MKKRQKIRLGLILFTFLFLPAIFFYMSPYLIIEATTQRIINGSFIIFLFLFLISLVLGRAFCGWVCPAGGCQEAISRAREKRVIKGNSIKWFIWIPWVAAIVGLAIKNRGYNKIDFLYKTTHGISIGDFYSFITYIFVLLLIAVPAYSVGKRSFCHHICWIAPFMIMGRKIRNLFSWASLGIVAAKDKCSHCHTCTNNCPMSLPVEQMVAIERMENSECILCGTCVDGCTNDVIHYTFFRSARAGFTVEP
jgi:ferredoxin-type protein NapH